MNEKSKQKPQMCFCVGCLGLRKVLGFDGGQIFQNLLLPHLTSIHKYEDFSSLIL